MFEHIEYDDGIFDDHVPVDGEVFNLGGGPNSILVEFLNTGGRLGLRVFNGLGTGVLLTEPQLKNLEKLIMNIMEHREDNDV